MWFGDDRNADIDATFLVIMVLNNNIIISKCAFFSFYKGWMYGNYRGIPVKTYQPKETI